MRQSVGIYVNLYTAEIVIFDRPIWSTDYLLIGQEEQMIWKTYTQIGYDFLGRFALCQEFVIVAIKPIKVLAMLFYFYPMGNMIQLGQDLKIPVCLLL
jgi:hypothetical protein